MKVKLLFFIFFFSILVTISNAQADYSNPLDVAQGFLDLCLEGRRFEACKLYCTEGSSDQIEILLKQMVTKDIPLVNDKCKYFVDSCNIDQQKKTAKCYYRKSCEEVKLNKKGFLTIKKIDDEWRVEYLWKRDKYL
jgi:hypothetical protein